MMTLERFAKARTTTGPDDPSIDSKYHKGDDNVRAHSGLCATRAALIRR
jgi:hypothetical protein